ncbi:helix-turn-helix domain-containing protein [Antarcticirhabdus aurantiaca]|uniref:Helix-turn-helix transcriptional regulator n=1 Tax=Antarcticirhabdus aurantiaca TaxID=2606717 RepID=A0ACD4NJ50_9HYPH|nr:helix-turn-helix transcriptional regulator [Jeongeuplla avenae]
MSAIGREIGTSYQQVKKYEAGDNRMSASTLFRLSHVLDVGIGDFFKGLPARTEQAGDGPADKTASAGGLGQVLDRVEDREVRQHLEGLLQALASRR